MGVHATGPKLVRGAANTMKFTEAIYFRGSPARGLILG